MNVQNDSNYSVISDPSSKYRAINKRIIDYNKLYFLTMKNHCYQLAQIQSKINEYNVNGEVKIKQLLEKQNYLIKELINIINSILSERRIRQISKKIEDPIEKDSFRFSQEKIKTPNIRDAFFRPYYILEKLNNQKAHLKEKRANSNEGKKKISENEPLKKKLSKSVEYKNRNKILYQSNLSALGVITPTNQVEFKGDLSNINLKSSNNNIKKKYGKFINKQKVKIDPKPFRHSFCNSIGTSKISSKSKIISHKKNCFLKTHNISNNFSSCLDYRNNYANDEDKHDNTISLISDRQHYANCYNIFESYGIMPNVLSTSKNRIMYKKGKIAQNDNNNNSIIINTARQKPIKTEFYITIKPRCSKCSANNNSNSSENKSFISCVKRSNSELCFLNVNKDSHTTITKIDNSIYGVPYINNGKRINPSRYTKEALNNSYKIVNKYEKKNSKYH